jgi:enoyl-CoA hydratase/carnithine racemase
MSTSPQALQASTVLLEKIENGIATLTLNRPERMNALNGELATALNNALGRLALDESVKVVVLTGAGRGFCAGGDLAEIAKARETGQVQNLEPILRAGMGMVLKMQTMPQPVIAAIHGPAVGAGMNVALAADIRIAAEDATFGETFANVGLFPDYGGTFLLPQLVGPSLAAELFYTGDMINADTALRFGIVTHVVPLNQLHAKVDAIARKIADGPTIPIRAAKQMLFAESRQSLEKALQREVEIQMQCFHSQDCREGTRAFLEKRKPNFQGK